ncbi:hypothetical protein ACA910_010798 [Epithemia clementina (nom. ined.)]
MADTSNHEQQQTTALPVVSEVSSDLFDLPNDVAGRRISGSAALAENGEMLDNNINVSTSLVAANSSGGSGSGFVTTIPSGGTADNPPSNSRINSSGSNLSSTNNPTSAPPATTSQARKVYRKDGNKWVTREIAGLDFLLGIPLAAEQAIVQQGWALKQKLELERRGNINEVPIPRDVEVNSDGVKIGEWWEHAQNLSKQNHSQLDETELERPVPSERIMIENDGKQIADDNGKGSNSNHNAVVSAYAPGRRLEGDEAIRVHIPVTTKTLTKQKMIARQAALREWELQTAHGLNQNGKGNQQHPSLLDGRLFFSAAGSYPMSVFSLIRYEPKKEEMQQRRQKLEALGGGGSQFVMPARDWRGISYRSLLPPRRTKHDSKFNRFLHAQPEKSAGTSEGGGDDMDDDKTVSSFSSVSSEDSDVYIPGLLDDPAMVLGRHRNVMIGDRVTGPIVSSTIQFVKPALLKAELNKQFRERFDGWDPPQKARIYIGGKVVDGQYVLMDPSEDYHGDLSFGRRSRQDSVTSGSTGSDGPNTTGPKEKQLRIPPSLTLSKIRSLKQQALAAVVKGKLQIGTLALCIVYFERLCLDCRVDKSNRRLAFAACLLLASKLNEPNVGLFMRNEKKGDKNDNVTTRLQSLIRPNKRSSNIFASLLEFFTEDWNLTLKHLFDAEWGVFAALGFSLHAKPSHVAFHFKRLMKTLDWNPRHYLGEQMYDQWQSALEAEEERRRERKKRRDRMRRRKEERLLTLRIEMENEVIRRTTEERGGVQGTSAGKGVDGHTTPTRNNSATDKASKSPRMSGMRLLNRFGMRRILSQDKMFNSDHLGSSYHPLYRNDLSGANDRQHSRQQNRLATSPSMPNISSASTYTTSTLTGPDVSGIVAIDIPLNVEDEASSIGSIAHSDKGIIV